MDITVLLRCFCVVHLCYRQLLILSDLDPMIMGDNDDVDDIDNDNDGENADDDGINGKWARALGIMKNSQT